MMEENEASLDQSNLKQRCLHRLKRNLAPSHMYNSVKSQIGWPFFSSVFFEFIASFLFYYIIYSAIINASLGLIIASQRIASSLQVSSPGDLHATDISIIIIVSAASLAIILVLLVFGPLSGSYLNPIVSFAFTILGKMTLFKGCMYVLVQIGASIVAAALAPLPFYAGSDQSGYPYDLAGLTVARAFPGASSVAVLIMEMVLSGIFVFFFLALTIDPETGTYIPGKSSGKKHDSTDTSATTTTLAEIPTTQNVASGADEKELANSFLSVSSNPPSFSILHHEETQSGPEHPSSIESHKGSPIDEQQRIQQNNSIISLHHYSLSNPHNSYSDSHTELEPSRPVRIRLSPNWYQLEKNIEMSSFQVSQFFVALSVGFLLAVVLWSGNVISGGAFNPARVFGPALINNEWDNVWSYFVGGLVGTVVASGFYHYVYLKARVIFIEEASKSLRNTYETYLVH